ncbi:MAG: response regulator, partial [Rhodoferax sp.]
HAIDSGRGLLMRLGEKPDVIVLDLTMPEIDGIEIIETLADTGYAGRLILASGFIVDFIDLAAFLARARGLNLVGVLHKPFRMAQLQDLLALSAPAVAA